MMHHCSIVYLARFFLRFRNGNHQRDKDILDREKEENSKECTDESLYKNNASLFSLSFKSYFQSGFDYYILVPF